MAKNWYFSQETDAKEKENLIKEIKQLRKVCMCAYLSTMDVIKKKRHLRTKKGLKIKMTSFSLRLKI